jgi:hypothetical protein
MRRPSPTPGYWIPVSRRTPCRICCGRTDGCAVSTDGNQALCLRVQSPRRLPNGGWRHRLRRPDSPAAQSGHLFPTLASIEHRDQVYRSFVYQLGLLPRHRDHLRFACRLPLDALRRFASAPPRDPATRRRIAAHLIRMFKDDRGLAGIPGFCVDAWGHWTCRTAPSGIMVPVPDASDRVEAYQVRADDPDPDWPHDRWYSTGRRPGGIATGTPLALWRLGLPDHKRFLITEGSLCASIVSKHIRDLTFGVPGVGNWREALAMIPRTLPVVVAFHADADADAVVNHEREAIAQAASAIGHPVTIAVWDPRFRGIDDAILGGATIRFRTWPEVSGAPVR